MLDPPSRKAMAGKLRWRFSTALTKITALGTLERDSNRYGIHGRTAATANCQLGHDEVPVLRNDASAERDCLHELRLDNRSDQARGTESERRDGDFAQHDSGPRPYL